MVFAYVDAFVRDPHAVTDALLLPAVMAATPAATTRFGNRILRGTNVTRFEPDGDGTRLTQTFETDGFVAGLMGRIFALGSYTGSFRGELEAFRQIAERESERTRSL